MTLTSKASTRISASPGHSDRKWLERASRYFRWNRKSDLKQRGRDGESNKAFPLTPPSPSGRGRMCERFVNIRRRLASIPRIEARRQGGPTNTCTTQRPGALSPSKPAEWSSLSLGERVGVRGKGLPCRLRLSFQPLAPVLIPPKIARNVSLSIQGENPQKVANYSS